jgi:hypothetical protein
VAIVARDGFGGAALTRMGAPTIVWPMRHAVDHVVEVLTAMIRFDGVAK